MFWSKGSSCAPPTCPLPLVPAGKTAKRSAGWSRRETLLSSLPNSWPCKCCSSVLPLNSLGRKKIIRGKMNLYSFIFLLQMTTDRKLFQVNGSLGELRSLSAPAISTSEPLFFHLGDPFRGWHGAFFAVVTNRHVLNEGVARLLPCQLQLVQD